MRYRNVERDYQKYRRGKSLAGEGVLCFDSYKAMWIEAGFYLEFESYARIEADPLARDYGRLYSDTYRDGHKHKKPKRTLAKDDGFVWNTNATGE